MLLTSQQECNDWQRSKSLGVSIISYSDGSWEGALVITVESIQSNHVMRLKWKCYQHGCFGFISFCTKGGGQDTSIITHPNDCDSKTCNCFPQSRAGLCDCEPLTFIAGMLHRATHTRSQHPETDFRRLWSGFWVEQRHRSSTRSALRLRFNLSLAFRCSEWNSLGPVIRRHQLLSRFDIWGCYKCDLRSGCQCPLFIVLWMLFSFTAGQKVLSLHVIILMQAE